MVDGDFCFVAGTTGQQWSALQTGSAPPAGM